MELFAGAGGLGLGFLLADHPLIRYQPLMAVDIDNDSINSYKRNMQWLFEHAPEILPAVPKIYKRDVGKLRSQAVLRAYKLKRGELDVLLGGPPCQGYSPSNRQTEQRKKNELNNLVKAFLDKVGDILPKMFLIENVQGVQWTNPTNDMHINGFQMPLFPNEKLRANDVRDYIVSTANILGYEVWHKIIDAADYGVPQRRMRFFILGIRKDIIGDRRINLSQFLNQKRVIKPLTVNQAIGDMPPLENGQLWKGADYTPSSHSYIAFLRKFMDCNELPDHFATKHQDHIIERYKAIPEGKNWAAIKHLMTTYTDVERTHSNIYRRLIGDGPAHTISHYRKSMTIHPSQHRGLSFREACRLQSFPDWFRFQGGSDSGQQQLAN